MMIRFCRELCRNSSASTGSLKTLNFARISHEESLIRSEEFLELMKKRRSVRVFSSDHVPFEVVENVIKTAGTAPSGAHKQPWTFVVVESKEVKERLKKAIENEEKINYGKHEDFPGKARMSKKWREDLEKFRTSWEKPYITEAPYIIVVFKQVYSLHKDGSKSGNYYQSESVGIATGFLIAALHNAGLVTLTHTPHPMNFLRDLLNRPKTEKPFLVLPVGYPSENCQVPVLNRKKFSDICKVI